VPASSVASPSRGGLVDDVVTAVDVKGLAGDQARCVVREERGDYADIVDADKAARRRLRFRLVEQLVEFRDPGRRLCRQRSEIACTRMPFGPSSAAI
jgi:hypothetical protein